MDNSTYIDTDKNEFCLIRTLAAFTYTHNALHYGAQWRVYKPRDYSRFAPSQWETSLQSNAVSHCLGAELQSALYADLHWLIISSYQPPLTVAPRHCINWSLLIIGLLGNNIQWNTNWNINQIIVTKWKSPLWLYQPFLSGLYAFAPIFLKVRKFMAVMNDISYCCTCETDFRDCIIDTL